MEYRFIEATNDKAGFGLSNHGKFMVGRFDGWDWQYVSPIYVGPLLQHCGWMPSHVLVVDLATGEGVIVLPRGNAKADLDKHKVWVCPMFEPFLAWLYTQDLSSIKDLPSEVDLGNVPSSLRGYRREGGA